MSRPERYNVDYFPHECNHSKELFIIEQRFGNDGYACWFKILEELGKADDHYLDLNDQYSKEYLMAILKITEETFKELIEKLAQIKMIDPELWKFNIIYSQKLVESVSDAYKNRKSNIVTLPSLCGKLSSLYGKLFTSSVVSDLINTQSKVKYSKVNKTIEKESKEKGIIPGITIPQIEEIVEYAKTINVCKKDAEHFWHLQDHNNWHLNNKPLNDWKVALNTYKSHLTV